MKIFRAIAAAVLAVASFAVSAGGFRVINNGVGQRGYAPLQPVVIEFFGGSEVITVAARYLYDPNRLRIVGIQQQGSFPCTSPGPGAIEVIGQSGGGGICLVFLEPLVTPYGVTPIQAQSLGCTPFPFGGSCSNPGSGTYLIIGPRISPGSNSAITLTSSVGLPSPTQVVRFTNKGDGSGFNSNLVITAGGSNALAAVSPGGTGPVLLVNQFRDYTLSCSTATAGTTTTNLTFAHNANPMDPTPITYALQCRIRVPPTLTYAPVTGTMVSIPGSAASVRTAQIDVAVSGGETQGARTLACTVPSGYAVTVEPGTTASSTFTTGAASGRIRLGCNSAAVPAQGTLTCTESGSPTRTWPISCAIDEAFTATPSFETPVVLTGLVGATPPTHSFTVTNTGTEATFLTVGVPSGLSGALSIAPSTAQSIAQGAAGTTYTITCSSLASFSGTQTLSLSHNGPGSPAQLPVTCNMRQPPTLQYAPSFGTGVQVSASVGAASRPTPIAVTTSGGDIGGERSLTCSAPSNYSVLVDQSPFPTGSAGAIRIGCDSINRTPGLLTCTESPGGTVRQWNLTCANVAVYNSSPRPSSAIGVYSAIGQTGFVSADVAVTNTGTEPLTIATPCIQTPSGNFGVSFSANPVLSTSTLRVECTTPPIGTAVFATLSCNTNDPTRSTVIYKLVCVAPPLADAGEGASPGERLTSPSPDGGALLGSSTVIAEGPNGEEIVVVGAPNGGGDGDGRVYVYVRPRTGGAGAGALANAKDKPSGRGLGKPVAVLRAPADRGKVHAKGVGNKFGDSVAINSDGTLIAVGAPTGGGSNTGQVLVFAQPPAGWGSLDDVVPTAIDAPAADGVVTSGFGEQVDFAPDGMLVVGAPGAIVSAVDDAGAAFLFDTNLQPVGAPITASSPEPGAQFGTALDVSSGMLAVGAPGENNSTGAAYFFAIDAAAVGPANRQTAPSGAFGDKWGSEVVIGGAAVVVGAPNDTTSAGANSGSATVFLQGDGNNVQFATTLVPPAGAQQGAGSALATNGNIVVVGAPLYDDGAETDRGRAIVYDLDAAAIGVGTPAGIYENTIGEAGDQFGASIALSNLRLLLGAPLSDEGTDVDEGRVDPFELDGIFRGSFDR